MGKICERSEIDRDIAWDRCFSEGRRRRQERRRFLRAGARIRDRSRDKKKINRETRVGPKPTREENNRGMQCTGGQRVEWRRDRYASLLTLRDHYCRVRFAGVATGMQGRRLNGEIFWGRKIRFSPVFSSFLARDRPGAVLERLRPVVFRKISSLRPARRPLGSGWTMVAYVSTYKSRIVRPPMFSRPHINPGGEKAVHPAIVQ